MICGYCGTELPDSALFCGECGRSLAKAGAAVRRNRAAADTALVAIPVTPIPVIPTPASPPAESAQPVAPEPVTPVVEPVTPVVEPVSPVVEPVSPVVEPVSPVVEPVEIPAPDLDATRIVAPGGRFVLQFSTGESVTVHGNGLLGRNPVAEPGEYFDHLVAIVDPGKSVSKTHLEFGQEDGEFWVSDRFSGNGSIARQPDGDPQRCDAGKRYRVARGTRVSIGEQFFVIS